MHLTLNQKKQNNHPVINFCGVEQRLARLAHNQKVDGSNPSPATNNIGNIMRGWILNSDLQGYKNLMEEEKCSPIILEQTEEKSLVQMTANSMQVWMQCGKFFEFA